MKVTFLGTGTSQGVPVIGCPCRVCTSPDAKDQRLRSSVLIEVGEKAFVIDTGPDFRQQMLRADVRKLDAVVFTHEHKDHLAGLDDIRAYNFILKKRIDVYASPRVQTALKRDFHYIFSDEKYPGIPDIELHTISNEPFDVAGVQWTPIDVLHYKLPVLGFRVGDFTYITDANHIPEKEKEKIKESKVLVINALRKESHLSHFTLDEAIDMMKELQPERGFFIHMSHQMGRHEEINEMLPDFIRLAYDGQVVEL